MKNRSINVLMSLKDKFSEPLKKIQTETKATEKEFQHAQNKVRNFGNELNNKFKSASLSVASFAATLSTVSFAAVTTGITALSVSAMELANVQTSAETKLTQMLSRVESIANGGSSAVDSATAELKAYAKELQNVGIYSDECILAGMSQMAVYQLNEKQIKKLSKAMVDLLANYEGYEADTNAFRDMGKQMGEAMEGNAGVFEENGIFLDEYQKSIIETGTAEERLALITQVISERVGDMNAELAKSDMGRQQNALNRFRNSLENLGRSLSPIKTALFSAFAEPLPKIEKAILPFVGKIAAKLTDAIPTISAALSGMIDKLPAMLESAEKVAMLLFDVFSTALSIGSDLLPLIVGITAGFASFNAINGVISLMTQFKTATQGITLAQAAFNAVLGANPIAITAIAIGAIVSVLAIAYTRSETFRNAVNGLFLRLAELGSMLTDMLVPTFTVAWNAILITITAFADSFGLIVNSLLDVLNGLIDFILGVFSGNWTRAWQGIVNAFAGVFGTLKNIALAPLNFILSVVDQIGAKISKITGTQLETHNATGTAYWKGGSTYVNEGNRGELVSLPSGSQIIPHDLAKKAIRNMPSFNISININGNVIGNEAYADEIGEHIVRKVKLAMENS